MQMRGKAMEEIEDEGPCSCNCECCCCNYKPKLHIMFLNLFKSEFKKLRFECNIDFTDESVHIKCIDCEYKEIMNPQDFSDYNGNLREVYNKNKEKISNLKNHYKEHQNTVNNYT
jgi:hypothetical protein